MVLQRIEIPGIGHSHTIPGDGGLGRSSWADGPLETLPSNHGDYPQRTRPSARRAWRIFDALSGLVALAILASYFSTLWWPLENLGSFRIQYFWLLLAAAAAYAVGRRPGPAIALAVLALINAASFVPLYFGGDRASGEPKLRVLYANLLAGNTHYAEFFGVVEEEDPDIIVLVEVGQAWAEQLEQLKDMYPYSYIDPHLGIFGVGAFSKLQPLELGAENWGPRGFPTLVGRFEVDGTPLTIIGAHPPPALREDLYVTRNATLGEIAAEVERSPGGAMVIGDLNATMDSPTLREFRRRTGLRDSRQGFGPQPSWWLFTPLLAVPIDHCLVSDEIVVHDRRLGPQIGSDHLPVIVDISLRRPPARRREG